MAAACQIGLGFAGTDEFEDFDFCIDDAVEPLLAQNIVHRDAETIGGFTNFDQNSFLADYMCSVRPDLPTL